MKKFALVLGFIVIFIAGIFYFLPSKDITGNVILEQGKIKLQVQIPCSGHAGLIQDSLSSVNGITNVKFYNPNVFLVSYDSNKLNKADILSISIFEEYPAKEI